MNRIATLMIALALTMAAAGCGSNDPAVDPMPDVGATSEPAPDTTEPEPDTPLPPDEKTGSITYAGSTSTYGGDDLTPANGAICETVNPAFEGDFNIQTKLADGTKFGLSGNINDYSGEFDGLALGDIGFEKKAEDLSINLDGRTLTGQGTVDGKEIEFTFTC